MQVRGFLQPSDPSYERSAGPPSLGGGGPFLCGSVGAVGGDELLQQREEFSHARVVDPVAPVRTTFENAAVHEGFGVELHHSPLDAKSPRSICLTAWGLAVVADQVHPQLAPKRLGRNVDILRAGYSEGQTFWHEPHCAVCVIPAFSGSPFNCW